MTLYFVISLAIFLIPCFVLEMKTYESRLRIPIIKFRRENHARYLN